MTTEPLSAYELLRREIMSSALAPGERLRVSELSARYDLGLTPVREALMRLASDGLVQNEANRGARVSATTVEELHDLMRTRREIERCCLERAIARGDAEWEAEILRSFHLLSRAALPADREDHAAATKWEVLHRKFHLALVSACDSPWLLKFWQTLTDHSERYRNLRVLTYRQIGFDARSMNGEHEAIAQAVLARDTEQAVGLMNAHLTHTELAVETLLSAQDAQSEVVN